MRNILICLVIAMFFLPLRPVSAENQEEISTPILGSVPNFRDIAGISASNGGTGFTNPTSKNGVMRTGVFYRSDALSLNGYGPYPKISNADWTTVSSLNIGRDIDLRTTQEITDNPERPPAGAAYTNINVYDSNAPGDPTNNEWNDSSKMIVYMEGIYHDFVANKNERAALGQVLLTLAHDSTPDLFHCDAGKDRTGWTAAILESIAGVSSTTIMNDYKASNMYMNTLINTSVIPYLQVQHPGADPGAIDAFVMVSSDYLNTALTQVTTSYGSMNAYLTQGLGLSQTDIYVLRAKMVYYQTLPGQNGFSGNAAAGAGLLVALQNSPLSGNYTAFNYYLQSAIDADTLGGVENQVGGQIYADAASFLLRRSQWIDEGVMSYTRGCDLGEGQTRIWMSDLGGGFSTYSSSYASSSTEYNDGMLIGVTHRFNDHVCAYLGVGSDWGSVRSAEATANVNTVLTTIGGRYGFLSPETGPFMTAHADVGYAAYGCTRPLDGGLGDATGKTDGVYYSGLVGLGDIIRSAPFTFTLQTAGRVTGVHLRSFDESGSELALDFNAIDKTYCSMLFDLGISLDGRQLGAWTIAPALTLGYERTLTNPKIQTTGTIYGYSVIQYSAFDSCDLAKVGLSLTGQCGTLMITPEINGLMGGAAKSFGLNGQLSIKYRF